MYAIVAHGGAGDWHPDKHPRAREGLTMAVEAGRALLADGACALDAVCETVRLLEDNPVFNAGTGGALNIDGVVELDASVMTGPDQRGGAVAGLVRVRHPVDVARAVMEKTDHVLLVGEGARRFARAVGFEDYDPETPDRREAWERALERLRTDGDDWLPRLSTLIRQYPDLTHGTVGAVAVDAQGNTAAATSTGGVVLKLAGRVGDSPILGAGTWADAAGAAGCTGRGEIAMRMLATRHLCSLIAAGHSASDAAWNTVRDAAEFGNEIGLIAVDANGGVGAAHDTAAMPHAFATHISPVTFRVAAEQPSSRAT